MEPESRLLASSIQGLPINMHMRLERTVSDLFCDILPIMMNFYATGSPLMPRIHAFMLSHFSYPLHWPSDLPFDSEIKV